MNGIKTDLIQYRILRARDTFEDAQILAEKNKWNSTNNRLYYAAYYAVMAILLTENLKPTTHNCAKSNLPSTLLKPTESLKNMGRSIHNFSHGGKKEIMMICLILTKRKLTLISNQYSN